MLIIIDVLLFLVSITDDLVRVLPVLSSATSSSSQYVPNRNETTKPAKHNTPVSSAVKEKNKTAAKKNDSSSYHYAKKVLPKSLLPINSKRVDGKLSYRPVTIDEYLYFVRETGVPYPNFIDAKPNNLIEVKAPKCYEVDCAIVGVDSLNKSFYALWLGNTIRKELKVIPDKNEIMLQESPCTP